MLAARADARSCGFCEAFAPGAALRWMRWAAELSLARPARGTALELSPARRVALELSLGRAGAGISDKRCPTSAGGNDGDSSSSVRAKLVFGSLVAPCQRANSTS